MNVLSWFSLVLGSLNLWGLLWAELHEQRLARAIFKTLCSLGFCC